MTDGDHGEDHSHVSGDGEHAPAHVSDSESGHDHGTDGHDHGENGRDHDENGHDHDENGHDHGEDGQVGDAEHHAGDASGVSAAVVTVSSTRSLDDDPAGDAIANLLTAAGHEVMTRDLVRDDFDGIQGAVSNLAKRGDVDVVVTTGGTGVSPDDVTPDAVEALFSKHLSGFGEEFRRRSVSEVGPMGIVSRATAGVAQGTVVAVLPGSEAAARTGTDLLTSVVEHLVGLTSEPDDDA